jgi:gamma-glutamylaminecyclotransferase
MCQSCSATTSSTESQPSAGALLFVYGTLRRGFENHEAYLRHARFIGTAVTLDKFALFLDDFPYLNKTPAVSSVVGEIYQVDDRTLGHIDCLEGHPEQYRREPIIVMTEQGRKYSAWAYFYPEPRGKLILSGDYLEGVKP